MTRSYAIIGGGVLGLTTALRLLQRGQRVTVFEREELPGGLAAGFSLATDGSTGVSALASADDPGPWLEKFYHHLFRSDTAVAALIREVGLGDALEWRRPLTVTLWGGRAYQLDSPLSLLRFQPLPLTGRLRMIPGLALLRFLPSPALFEGRTAAPWVRQVLGPGAYEVILGPLLRGKFGAVSEEIALPWLWARFHDRSEELGYLRGGFQRFYNRLAQRVRELGGDLRFGCQIQRIERAGAATDAEGITLHLAPLGAPQQTERHTFDRCVSTLPTRLTCQLAPQLPAEYRARYEWGRAYGAHCLIIELDRPLTSSYWMNINDPDYPFMVLVEHTNYMPPADYGGGRLLYLGNYRAMDDPLFTLSQRAVLDAFLPHLARINPDFEESWVQRSWMFAAPYAQPIVTTEYREHIPPFETPLPGLYVANMFQVYPHDRGQNYSVALAEQAADRLEPQKTA